MNISIKISKKTQGLTSYDLLKTLAIILMVVDHIGFYFFPDDLWWRVAGRLCVPMWFFLIGYASSRDLGLWLWIAAGLLVVINVICGMWVLPLNIIFTILFVRLVLDKIMQVMRASHHNFWGVTLLISALAIPTWTITEYGSTGLMLAIFGYLVKHKDKILQQGSGITQNTLHLYMATCIAVFAVLNTALLSFSQIQFYSLTLGLCAVMISLLCFKPAVFTKAPPLRLLQWIGRHTLLLYTAHLVVFKAAALYLFPEKLSLFTFEWIMF